MRIGIDARFYGEAGGIARYTERLITELERVDHSNEYVIFLRDANWNSYTPSNPRFTKYRANVKWYGWVEQVYMPFHLRRARVNLMHFPHWNIPLCYRGAFVVTIHDLILFHFPSTRATTRSRILYVFKQWVYRRVIRHAARHARHIIVPSLHTKRDVMRLLCVAEQRISVTYEGVDAPPSARAPQDTQRLLSTYTIRTPYALYVGVAYPHKNLEWLIHAVTAYTVSHEPLQLVLVGAPNYFYHRIAREFAPQIASKQLVLTGFVSDEDLAILFTHAATYVFPSLYEGFGLPPLQACAYSTPVLSSNRACMPEILGDAALYFNPTDMADFCAQLDTILHNKKTREKLVQNGLKRYQQFSWTKMAELTLRIYTK